MRQTPTASKPLATLTPIILESLLAFIQEGVPFPVLQCQRRYRKSRHKQFFFYTKIFSLISTSFIKINILSLFKNLLRRKISPFGLINPFQNIFFLFDIYSLTNTCRSKMYHEVSSNPKRSKSFSGEREESKQVI